jgi:hypothetical protein
MNDDVYTLAGGEISLWLDECGAVMLKLNTAYKNPVELGEGEVQELIDFLTTLHTKLVE